MQRQVTIRACTATRAIATSNMAYHPSKLGSSILGSQNPRERRVARHLSADREGDQCGLSLEETTQGFP
jgi:hypothetical protein